MKSASLLTFMALTFCSVTASWNTWADDYNYETDQVVESYDTMFFADSSLEEEAFNFEAYDTRTGEMVLLPFGQADFPHAAIAKVTSNRLINGSFKITKITSAFTSTQSDVQLAIKNNIGSGFIGADDNMIFLDENRTIVDGPANAVMVVIPNALRKTIGGLIDVAFWNECSDKDFTGNYSGIKCSKRRWIDEGFKKFLNKNILRCTNEGLKNIGKSKAKAVHVVHGGVAADKRHSPRSLHSVGRAIDIRILIATTNSGKVTMNYPKASQGKKTERSFYNAFHSCWSKSVIATDSACRSKKGTNGLAGIIRWEHPDHRKHVHASLPYCRSSKYYSK